MQLLKLKSKFCNIFRATILISNKIIFSIKIEKLNKNNNLEKVFNYIKKITKVNFLFLLLTIIF